MHDEPEYADVNMTTPVSLDDLITRAEAIAIVARIIPARNHRMGARIVDAIMAAPRHMPIRKQPHALHRPRDPQHP